MKLIIQGNPKEIAALVLAVQERQKKRVGLRTVTPTTESDRENLAQAIRSVLFSQTTSAENQKQQPDAIRHIQNQDELYPAGVSDCE